MADKLNSKELATRAFILTILSAIAYIAAVIVFVL